MFSTIKLLFLVNLTPIILMANPFVDAGERYGIDPWLLYSIAKVESGLNPLALGKNTNGTYDMGIMQINTCHHKTLAKFGISKEDLWNPETNINVGAWVLAGCVKRNGYTTKAIDCYNGDKTGRYSRKVLLAFNKEVVKWQSK
ncbi:MAG: lytic transglycosylase domain-containing protein [Sulfurimonas sp.]|jgi:soluble lytic murein transglycosylase-like protein